MLPTPAPQIAREFAICTSLSFLVILGIIHLLLHVLHASVISGATPFGKFLAAPAVQIAQITQLHSYVLVVFKVTMACTILVLALREVLSCAGVSMGWWAPVPVPEEPDLEAGKLEVECDSDDWSADEKVPYSAAPYPNETVLFL